MIKMIVMRQCSKCGEMKSEDEFYNWKRSHQCKQCICQRNKKYRGKKAEYDRNYNQENYEKKAKQKKKYDQENREKVSKQRKNHRQEHKEEIAEQNKIWYEKTGREKGGHISMYKNKSCANYLGIVIGERLCRHLFKDVKVMPNGNPKFDFICSKGKKIDVKSACVTLQNSKYPRWKFCIDRNKVADYFICVAFDNVESLNPIHIWMIPGKELNHLSGIAMYLSKINKWSQWERNIKDAQSCCAEMKKENYND